MGTAEGSRSRSRSPRRNSWREDIRKIRSWKEENEISRKRLQEKRNDRNRGFRKLKHISEKTGKKLTRNLTTVITGSKNMKERRKEAMKSLMDLRRKRPSSLPAERKDVSSPLGRSRESLGAYRKQVVINSGGFCIAEGPLTRNMKEDCLDEVKERDEVHRDLDSGEVELVQMAFGTRESEHKVSLSDDIGSIEIKNDKKITCMKRISDGTDTKKVVAGQTLEGEVSVTAIDVALSGPAFCGDDEVTKMNCVSTLCRRASSLVISDECTVNETAQSEKDGSALARKLSLLELKMEVYTIRLKELEWEREQLRKERGGGL